MTRDLSPGKRWRFRRDLVIALAHRAGCSQRLLADVFDLARSRVAQIVREVEELGRSAESDRSDCDDEPHAVRRCVRPHGRKTGPPRTEG